MAKYQLKTICMIIISCLLFGTQNVYSQYNIPRGWMDGGGLSPIYPAGIDSGYSKQIAIGTNTAINGMELTIVGSQTVTGKLSVGTTTTISDTALNVVGSITVSQGIKFGDNTSLTSASGLSGNYISNTNGSSTGMTDYGTLTTKHIQVGSSSVITVGTSTEIVFPSQSNARVQTLEFSALDGVTSAIQTQLDGKIASTNGSSTGLTNYGTLTTDYLNFGGTQMTHSGSWTETTTGTHTITASAINLNAPLTLNYSSMMDSVRIRPFLFCEFLATGASSYDPFLGSAITSGAIGSVGNSVLTGNYPGVQKITGSSSANSGYSVKTGVISILIGGGEICSAIYNIQSATATTRIGFIDTSTFAQPVDGAWLSYNGTMTVVGNTSNSSTYSTTTSSFTGTTNTWYRGAVAVGSSATRVDYSIYDSAGTLLWTDNLTTNIPTASGRDTGAGIICTTPDTTAQDLLLIDWMGIGWTKSLTR